MDEAKLEDKLKELVKEFGEMANPQYKKLASLAQKAKDNRPTSKKC
jgi:hypothetical protein